MACTSKACERPPSSDPILGCSPHHSAAGSREALITDAYVGGEETLPLTTCRWDAAQGGTGGRVCGTKRPLRVWTASTPAY